MMNSAPTKLRLKILSDPANLAGIRQAIEMLCAENGFEQKVFDEVGLCVNEALANVIRHAYAGKPDEPIEVTAQVVDGSVRITIRDWGNGVDPMSLPAVPPDPLRPGGLGLICLRQMMNDLKYVPQSDGMLLEMSKHK